MLPTVATSLSPPICLPKAARHSKPFPTPTPSSSIPTSTVSSHTAAAASSSATPQLAASINTTRPTLTSPQKIFTSAKSPSSALAPEPLPSPSGPPSNSSHPLPAEPSPKVSKPATRPPSNSISVSPNHRIFLPQSQPRNSTSSSGPSAPKPLKPPLL